MQKQTENPEPQAANETQKVPLGWPELHVLHTMSVQRLFEFWHEANEDLINDTLAVQPETVRAAPTDSRIPPAFHMDWNKLLFAWKAAEKIHRTIEADEVVNSATLQTWWHQEPRPTHLIEGLLLYETEDMDKPQWPRLIWGIVNDVFPQLQSTPEIQREIIYLLQKEPNFEESLIGQWTLFDMIRKTVDLPDYREEDQSTLFILEDDKWDSEGRPFKVAKPQQEAQRRLMGPHLIQAPGPMEAKFRDLCYLSGVEPDWSMLRCLREQDLTRAAGIKSTTQDIETTLVVTTPAEMSHRFT